MIKKQTLILLTLMLVGETIFFLPFLIPRVFRPTFLTVFEIDNLQLGTAFSTYGVVAMVSYFLGGPIADRFSATILILIYGFWGFSTILLFWAAYIKGIRKFGGETTQGLSQGLVDGGRGAAAAIITSISVLLIDLFIPTSANDATQNDLSTAFSLIILLFAGIVTLTAFAAWRILPSDSADSTTSSKIGWIGIKQAIRHKTVWLQAIILLCAYVGYKSVDDFGLYAQDTFGYDDVESAHIATISFWMRPIGAAIAGYLGDKFIHSRITNVCFIILIIGAIILSSGILSGGLFLFIAMTLASMSLGIYGLRGLYYALFQESKIPLSYTGAAIGFISVIGYTPDVFMGPLMGILLDNNPGSLGHQYLFGVLSIFGLIGLIASILFRRSILEK